MADQHKNHSEQENSELIELTAKLLRLQEPARIEFQQELEQQLVAKYSLLKQEKKHRSLAVAPQHRESRMMKVIKQFLAALGVLLSAGLVSVAANENLRNNLVDNFQPKGSLVVMVEPTDETVQLYIDTVPYGESPLEVKRLSVGIHTLKVVKEQYKDFFQEFTIEPRKLSTIHISIEATSIYSDKGQDISIQLVPLPTATPVITKDASSEFSEKGLTYSAERVFDGDVKTAWVEAEEGFGKGAWIQSSFPEMTIKQIAIYPGCNLYESSWKNNNRPKDITLIFSSGQQEKKSLSDERRLQIFTLDKPQLTSSLRVVLESVFQGEKFDDTCISEIVYDAAKIQQLQKQLTATPNHIVQTSTPSF